MNKVFKIVYNAVRGKMMVVNEMTSSMQVGRKKARVAMVVGAALLGLGGGANADQSIDKPPTDTSFWNQDSVFTSPKVYVPKNNPSTENLVDLSQGPQQSGIGFAAGYSNDEQTEVKSNSVVIRNGVFDGRIYGGLATESNASENSVTILVGENQSVTIDNDDFIYGAHAAGTVTKNSVSIDGGTINVLAICGGSSAGGNAYENSVSIINGNVSGDIYGAYTEQNDAEVKANYITINGGTLTDVRLYGGFSFNGGSVTYNQVKIIKGKNSSLTGSFAQVFGGYHSAQATVSNNTVTIDAPDAFFESVAGGNMSGSRYAEESVNNNVVTIISGKFQLLPGSWNANPVVAGGSTGQFNNSENNHVNIQGGTFGTEDADCLIVGGGVSNGYARDNSVSVSGNADLQYASLYGGMKETDDGYEGVYGGSNTPNTLYISSWKGTVKSIQGFDVINFNGVNWDNGAILVEAEYLELDNTKITVTVKGATITADSESMTLIKTTEEIEGNLATSGNTVTLNEGIANTYSGTIEKDRSDKAITVTLSKTGGESGGGTTGGETDGGTGDADDSNTETGNGNTPTLTPQMNEQILVLGESRAAATAFTNQATDLIDSTLDDMGQKATLGMSGFAAVHGNASEYETGSHVDVNGWSMIVGASSKLENGTAVGAFFETGTGNYRTFNDLDGVTMRGDGESTYWGGGLMTRHAFDNGFYAEGSVRIGKLENELKNAVKGSQGLTGYDIDTLYFGAHVGAGKVFELNSAGDNVDVYGKFLYTYNEGKNFAIDGDSVNYSSVTSERLRLGARYTKNVSDKLQAKIGAAWEYDFNGDSKNTVANYDLGTPSLGGSTFMADVGVRYQAAKNVSVDFSGRGYTGKREGVSGQVNVKFSF